ncbi:ATP-binding cassette domain-containing protein [Stackebrandtia albiflava]|uniref:ATP-binding cassette domain-containing protein n=1 Tax=Stackebrandtia albiflava TaxID=406432 RepID=UPI0011BD48A8
MLELSGLTAGYHGGTVLHGVDLTVEPGGVTAVVGHNGAGKTTLCQAVAGLLPASGGAVRWDGEDVTSRPTHRRTRMGIGYVPQGRRVFGSVSVAEHLAIARRRDSAWTVDDMWEMFPQLAARRRHHGGLLSGGEQQMLAIARALLTGPRLLVLDEPTEGLAPVIVEQIRSTVGRLAESGMAVLLAAPQPQWPIATADRLCVLDAGRVTGRFTGTEVREDPKPLIEMLEL